MRSSVVMLLTALAGILAGAALIGPVALGVAIIFDSLCVGAYGLVTHDWGAAEAPPSAGATLESIFERAARAS